MNPDLKYHNVYKWGDGQKYCYLPLASEPGVLRRYIFVNTRGKLSYHLIEPEYGNKIVSRKDYFNNKHIVRALHIEKEKRKNKKILALYDL